MKVKMFLGVLVLALVLVFAAACGNPGSLPTGSGALTVEYTSYLHESGLPPVCPDSPFFSGQMATAQGNVASDPLVRSGFRFIGWNSPAGLILPGDTFPVNASTILAAFWQPVAFGIELDHGSTPITDDNLDFGSARFGYDPVTPKIVTVTNVGGETLSDVTVTIRSGADFFGLGLTPNESLEVSITLGSIGAGATAEFKIAPRDGRDARAFAYGAFVEVDGGSAQASFTAQFQVEPAIIGAAEFTVDHPVALQAPADVAGALMPQPFPPEFKYNFSWGTAQNFSEGGIYAAIFTLTAASANFTFTGGLSTARINGQDVTPSIAPDGRTATLSLKFVVHHIVNFYEALPTGGERRLNPGDTLWKSAELVGYDPAVLERTIILRNTSERQTGVLNLNLSGGSFAQTNMPASADLAPGQEVTFQVRPVPGRTAGSHGDTLTASNAEMSTQIGLRFTVQGFIYVIHVDRGWLDFGICMSDGHRPSQAFMEPFYMSRTVITRGEYNAVRAWVDGPSNAQVSADLMRPISQHTAAHPNRPASWINWFDAIKFANLASMKAGLLPAYVINGDTNPEHWPPVPIAQDGGNINWEHFDAWNAVSIAPGATGYRLATPQQWEFAAKGGRLYSPYVFSGSNNLAAVGWYTGDPGVGAGGNPVFGRAANALGIYGLSGNVQEWGWGTGAQRPSRGGSFTNSADLARNVGNNARLPGWGGTYTGIRLVRPVASL